jgi:hypothetical protein
VIKETLVFEFRKPVSEFVMPENALSAQTYDPGLVGEILPINPTL